MERPRKSAAKPKAPEKDSHGCIIGVEVWDVEKRKCVPIVKPARVGTKSLQEQERINLQGYL